jgi:hypothetical protein
MSDTMRIVVLEDGTIRTETDRISAPAHQSAEAFLATVTTFTGGPASRTKKVAAHVHHVDHVHNTGS